MTTRDLVVVNRLGLHARAAAKVVQCLGAYASRVAFHFRGREVNAKSIMGLLLLAAPQGSVVRATAEGDDAGAALDALEALFASRFGEPD